MTRDPKFPLNQALTEEQAAEFRELTRKVGAVEILRVVREAFGSEPAPLRPEEEEGSAR